jgi:NitT/TauT family transport system ATP-binding protein
VIAIRHVSKWFPVRGRERNGRPPGEYLTALDDVSLSVGDGEIVSLLGPSGCGKTTLLRIVAGLLPRDAGSIEIDGREPTGPEKGNGFVFQNFGLLPWRTVIANVAFPLEVDGVPRPERLARAQDLLDLVGLSGFERHYPHEISGGMQQRVGIARALLRRPRLLLMDEPFGALDAQTREELQEEFLRIWDRHRTTVLFVTHSIDEALLLSHRVAVFTRGPGRIKAVVDVPLGQDERRAGDVRTLPRFVERQHHLRELMRH